MPTTLWPKKNQWRRWTLPTKYSVLGFLVSVVAFGGWLIEKSVDSLAPDPNAAQWYEGDWVVDMARSMPEFQRQYDHYEREFGQRAMQLMDWPKPGAGMSDAVFHFDRTGGQMLRSGHSSLHSGVAEKFETQLGEDLSIVGDANYKALSGLTSVVTFNLEPQSKTSARLIVQRHDMKLLGTEDLTIPDGSIVQDNSAVVMTSHYFITKNVGCEGGDGSTHCARDLQFFPTKIYLVRAPDSAEK